MKRLAVVVGHTEKSPGACCPTEEVGCEWFFNKGVAETLVSAQIDIYTYPPLGVGYTRRVDTLAEEINSKDYEAVIELHYNAASGPEAHGTEALYYYKSKEGKRIANLFCDTFTEAFDFRNRGARNLHRRNQRGFYFLQKMKAPAIILEPFFSTSPKDMKAVGNLDDIKSSYGAFLYYFFQNFILNK